jgi:hypothetical protein
MMPPPGLEILRFAQNDNNLARPCARDSSVAVDSIKILGYIFFSAIMPIASRSLRMTNSLNSEHRTLKPSFLRCFALLRMTKADFEPFHLTGYHQYAIRLSKR